MSCLTEWLSITWDRPERSYNPNVRDFLSALLEYPRDRVVTEDSSGPGFADIHLATPSGDVWVVGDLKKDDGWILDQARYDALWNDKKKYVSGLTRYVLFLSPSVVDVLLPNGQRTAHLPAPINLNRIGEADLRAQLAFISFTAAAHERQWQVFIKGELPYSYLALAERDNQYKLDADLKDSFRELSSAAEKILAEQEKSFAEFQKTTQDINQSLATEPETRRRALNRLAHVYRFPRKLFEQLLPSFEEQYGRDIETKTESERRKRMVEAFAADSVAALVARVLFLRLVEDLQLTQKRRLSNGGPENWSRFVEELTGDAQALFRTAAEDVSRIYVEPFEPTVFDWIQEPDSPIGLPLQRLILRLNGYDFSTLSEEILGDIYQQFLPQEKRKRLGEFYTPASISDYLLGETVGKFGRGRILDPACGSGSFLVREVHSRILDAKQRGLDPEAATEEILSEIYGFDLNPFAAFITRFQVMWAVLRFYREKRDVKVNVFNINALLKDSDIAQYLGAAHLPPGSQARDNEHWNYIVGNPPYIRAERIKYGTEMQRLWRGVWGQNSDTGLLFLDRALREWLLPNGHLGMVVSGGYANSEAVAPIWSLLHPGAIASLRKIVWLEFVENVWEPNVIPMLLVIEKVTAREDDVIEIAVPATWPDTPKFENIRYSDFFDSKVNPSATAASPWGHYLLPLLKSKDVEILRSLFPDYGRFQPLRYAVKERTVRGRASCWTYGIQRGGAEASETKSPDRDVQVFGGRDISVGLVQPPSLWVDLREVASRKYGKPSLWRDDAPDCYLAVNEISLAPAAAVVGGEKPVPAALNSVVVAIPRTEGPAPEAIAAYLNSELARFYWATTLRSGVLEGSSRSHMYPRVLESLPWPVKLSSDQERTLHNAYSRIVATAQRTIAAPQKWLADTLAVMPPSATIHLSNPTAKLNFQMWCDPSPDSLTIRDHNALYSGLSSFTVADQDLAGLILALLQISEEKTVTRGMVQSLSIPKNWSVLSEAYAEQVKDFNAAKENFSKALGELNNAVFDVFGIGATQRKYVETRLRSFPLDRLIPRYPWVSVKAAEPRSYIEDRFE